MMILKSFILSCFVLLISFNTYGAHCLKCLQNSHPYGAIANSPSLDDLEKNLPASPPLSKSGKSFVTYNQFGFDVQDEATLKKSWLVQEILKFSQHATSPMLDIGGGYGRLSKMMLQSGATVIYNDLDARHVLFGRKLANEKERQRLYINTFNFPQGMIIKPNTLSGVVLYRVLHFMPPDQCEEGIAKIKRWLVPGGKVFIATLPPQHGEFKDKVLTQYEAKWKQGNLWPGYAFDAKDILPEQAYALPKALHLMDDKPLVKVLEKYGFVIEKQGFIDMKEFGQSAKRDGHELFGIIARKA